MSVAHNPYQPGDRVQVARGPGWIAGTVVKIVLARCHTLLDDCQKVTVDDYHEIRRVS